MRIEIDPKGIVFMPADDIDHAALGAVAAVATRLGHKPVVGDYLRVDLPRGANLGPTWLAIYEGVLAEGIEVVRSVVYCDDRANLPALCNKRTPF